MTGQWSTRLRNLPDLITPPIVPLLRNRWKNRDRQVPDIPDAHLYRPTYSPWLGEGPFGAIRDRASRFTLVSPDRLWVLYCLARNALLYPGDFVECGVYKGGTAHLLAKVLEQGGAADDRRLALFDTFGGMPETDPSLDKHRAGDFADTSLDKVRGSVGPSRHADFYPGFIPDSFAQAKLEAIALLHIDLDIHDSILATLDHCFDKLAPGGVIVFDDYGFESCYGARVAVDAFFAERPETPLCLPTGQAVVVRGPV